MDSAPTNPARFTFRRRHRLSKALDYRAAYKEGLKRVRGPLVVFARPNGLGHPRLGLSVGRRVGPAVKRNAIKRRLREAFRHLQHEVGAGYDVVVNVRPHGTLGVEDYQRLLGGCWKSLDNEWRSRLGEGGGAGGDGGADA
ncbi:MAG: ribonuclease P protein component [Phycisphaeraceae bacterium]|nr:MAG: ribonuclease P protein component [Phycisphaeraceae bacterium]